MKVNNSFAAQHSNEIPTFGVARSDICKAIFICTISCSFFQACICQLMLLNNIYCTRHSCPSAHVRFCVFVSLVANKFLFLKPEKRILTIQDVQRKRISCICDFLFVCCKYQYSDSGILEKPAEHLLFYL